MSPLQQLHEFAEEAKTHEEFSDLVHARWPILGTIATMHVLSACSKELADWPEMLLETAMEMLEDGATTENEAAEWFKARFWD